LALVTADSETATMQPKPGTAEPQPEQPMTSEQLKPLPCPFCGKSAAAYAHDEECYFKVLERIKQAPQGDISSMAELIPAWNRRGLFAAHEQERDDD